MREMSFLSQVFVMTVVKRFKAASQPVKQWVTFSMHTAFCACHVVSWSDALLIDLGPSIMQPGISVPNRGGPHAPYRNCWHETPIFQENNSVVRLSMMWMAKYSVKMTLGLVHWVFLLTLVAFKERRGKESKLQLTVCLLNYSCTAEGAGLSW